MWFKVCDGFSEHPKAIQAGNEAVGVWTRMGSWSSRYCTGGVVPHVKALAIAGAMAPLTALLKAGLLEREDKDEADWVFHDWEDANPTAEEARAYTENKKKAGRLGAQKRWKNGPSPKADTKAPAIAGAMGGVMAKGTGTGTGTGKGNKKEVPDDVAPIWEAFETARRKRYPTGRSLSPSRERMSMIRARLKDNGEERVMAAMQKFFDPRYHWAGCDDAKNPELLFRSVGQFEKVENASPKNDFTKRPAPYVQSERGTVQEMLDRTVYRRDPTT